MKKQTVAVIALAVAVASTLSLMVGSNQDAETAAVIATYKKPPRGPGISGPGSDYAGIYYSEAHMMADKIDLTQLPPAEKLDIPEELYSGKVNAQDEVDLGGEIRTYKLICEILSELDINPSDSDVFIRPYHVYGSWFGEIQYSKKQGGGRFNPDFDKVVNPGNGDYLGPFSMDQRYYTQKKVEQFMPRMYAYISSSENKDVQDNQRALRISKEELTSDIINDEWVGINNGSLTLEQSGKAEYVSRFKESLRFEEEDRPNPEYLPDAVFTYCRKLRTNYQGRNNYTLNSDDVIRWDDFDKTYAKYVTRGGDYKSDLYFLGSVYKNSSELKPHQYDFEAGYPSKANSYVNAMPYLYMEMIEQYGSLDINEIGLFNGWREKNTSVQKFFGTRFVTPMYSAKIESKDNLISRLDSADTKVFEKNSVRKLMVNVHKYACSKGPGGNSELEWSLYYPLRCITNGKMIQSGVESMIKQVYDIQLANGVIGGENQSGGFDSNGDGEITDDEKGNGEIIGGNLGMLFDDDIINPEELRRRARLTPGERPSGKIDRDSGLGSISNDRLIFPILIPKGCKYRVSHGYWCGKSDNDFSYYDCAKWHSGYGQHQSIDFNFRQYNKKSKEMEPATSDVLAVADGVVVSRTSDGPYGTRVVLTHSVDGLKYYSNYAHMKKGSTSHLSVGDRVQAGEVIGHIGSTGNSSGNHLHFAVYTGSVEEKNNKAVAYDALLLTSVMAKRG